MIYCHSRSGLGHLQTFLKLLFYGDGSFILYCLAATFNLKLRLKNICFFFFFLFGKHDKAVVSSRLQAERDPSFSDRLWRRGSRRRVNFCSYHTILDHKIWQAVFHTQWGVPLLAFTTKSSSSFLPWGCKMHNFRQIILIMKVYFKQPSLSEIEGC